MRDRYLAKVTRREATQERDAINQVIRQAPDTVYEDLACFVWPQMEMIAWGNGQRAVTNYYMLTAPGNDVKNQDEVSNIRTRDGNRVPGLPDGLRVMQTLPWDGHHLACQLEEIG